MELWRITPATKTRKTSLNIFEKKNNKNMGRWVETLWENQEHSCESFYNWLVFKTTKEICFPSSLFWPLKMINFIFC